MLKKQKLTKKENNISSYFIFDRHLRSKKGLLISWIVIILLILLLSINFGLNLHFLNSNNLSFQAKFIMHNQEVLVNANKALIYTGFVLIFLPIAFLIGCWITGINGVYQSVYYHWFVWILYSVAIIFSIIVICLTINIYININ